MRNLSACNEDVFTKLELKMWKIASLTFLHKCFKLIFELKFLTCVDGTNSLTICHVCSGAYQVQGIVTNPSVPVYFFTIKSVPNKKALHECYWTNEFKETVMNDNLKRKLMFDFNTKNSTCFRQTVFLSLSNPWVICLSFWEKSSFF